MVESVKIPDQKETEPKEPELKHKVETKNEESDDEDWITPENLGSKGVYFGKEKIGTDMKSVPIKPENLQLSVGIVTSDFAMQNVILQIGIPLFSPDGVKVEGIRQFVLRCRTCREYFFSICENIKDLIKMQNQNFALHAEIIP